MSENQHQPLGYVRDASWWANPNTSAPKRVHLIGDDAFARCSSKIMLDTEKPIAILGLLSDYTLCRRCFPMARRAGWTIAAVVRNAVGRGAEVSP